MSRNQPLPWFRLYTDAIDDAKLRLLAPSDRWYYVAILCCKGSGLLDNSNEHTELRQRKIAVKLEITLAELEELRRRLVEVGLVDGDFQPRAWSKRQHSATPLPEGESLEHYRGYVYFIAARAGPVKIGYSKNPWARLKDFQTGHPEKLSVVATVKTTEQSERGVHALFSAQHLNGEWFERNPLIANLVNEIRERRIKTEEDVARYVEQLSSNYVAAT